MSKAEPLYRLQLLDIDLDKARKQLREVEGALSSNPAVSHAKAELNTAKQAHQQLSADLRALELEASVIDEKIKADEDHLYTGNIRTPKELIDLQREVEVLKRHRSEMDDKLLATMMRVEEAYLVVQHCQAAVEEATRHWQDDSVGLHDERTHLLDRISANEERREAICIAIPRADLATYTSLRNKKPNGVAVTLVKDGACGQCGESASSVLLQQTRTGTSLTMCTTCGRILHIG
jgi:predicted  nucleic acid-binding Zn-ribbon protein